jgi:hypothetical protein
MVRVATVVAVIAIMATGHAAEPKKLREARRKFESLRHPTETDRVRYVTLLVRLRESFSLADYKILDAIDAEVIKHPILATANPSFLRKRLEGGWQSPRHRYFYHADGTWATDEDIPENSAGKWRIEGNRFFEDRVDEPAAGEKIILLTSTDFVYATDRGPYYLRRGTAFPWRD